MQSALQALSLSAALVWQRPCRFGSPGGHMTWAGTFLLSSSRITWHWASHRGLNPALILPLRHIVCVAIAPQGTRPQDFSHSSKYCSIKQHLHFVVPDIRAGTCAHAYRLWARKSRRKSRASSSELQDPRFLTTNVWRHRTSSFSLVSINF